MQHPPLAAAINLTHLCLHAAAAGATLHAFGGVPAASREAGCEAVRLFRSVQTPWQGLAGGRACAVRVGDPADPGDRAHVLRPAAGLRRDQETVRQHLLSALLPLSRVRELDSI